MLSVVQSSLSLELLYLKTASISVICTLVEMPGLGEESRLLRDETVGKKIAQVNCNFERAMYIQDILDRKWKIIERSLNNKNGVCEIVAS